MSWELIQPNVVQLLIVAPLAFVALVGLLMFIDKLNGISFTNDVWSTIKQDPRAVADYFGRRFLAGAILVGLIVLKSL